MTAQSTSQTTESTEHREFGALVDAYGAEVLALLRRLCRNHADADDVFQETAVRVWRHWTNRPKLTNPRAWLMTIAYRAFLDQRSRSRRHEPIDDPPDVRLASPEHHAEHAEATAQLHAAVAALPELVRAVVLLHYSGGLSLRETGRAIGVSEGTVKSRLNTALKQLRGLLQ